MHATTLPMPTGKAPSAAESPETSAGFSLRNFAGCVTIFNPTTGQHRTFRIRRQRDNSKFAPGERIISLLTGPDNENDYEGFGFVKDDGRIILWRRVRESRFYASVVRMLENPDHYTDRHGIEYATEARCLRCFRLLTDPISIAAGLGPECRNK